MTTKKFSQEKWAFTWTNVKVTSRQWFIKFSVLSHVQKSWVILYISTQSSDNLLKLRSWSAGRSHFDCSLSTSFSSSWLYEEELIAP